MEIHLFSENKKVISRFEEIKLSKENRLKVCSHNMLNSTLKGLHRRSFIYYDIGDLDEKAQNRQIRKVSNAASGGFGIIDPRNAVKDPASLFHMGASDYINRDLLKEPIRPKRITEALEFNKSSEEIEDSSALPVEYIPSGSDWSGVKTGKEYTFCFMFIELDNQKSIKRMFGGDGISAFSEKLQQFIEKITAPTQGRIWIWNELGGLVLFPFDGENCDAVLTAFRLILYRSIYCIEEFDYDMHFSYRIAMHMGNTVYRRRGDTGTIVSDSINSIFHLGHKFTAPGNLYLTQDVFPFIPAGLKKCFFMTGEYEDREIYRMRLPEFHYSVE